MSNSTENIHKEVLDLEKNSRRVKTAHFLAAQRKQKMHRILGFLIIIANIIIFSPLLDLTIPEYSATAVKSLAIIGASLAGVQTLFNFQKDVELHLNAGDKYANIYHKLGTLLAEYGDNMVYQNTLIKEFKMLQKEYLEANNSYKSCVPSNRDYDLATESLKKRTP